MIPFTDGEFSVGSFVSLAMPTVFLILLVPYVAPFILDPVMRKRLGYEDPYKWGYFLGLCFLIIGVMHFVMAPIYFSSFEEEQLEPIDDFLFGGLKFEWIFLAQGVLAIIFGAGITLRRRWGWVLFFTTLLIAPVAVIAFFFGVLGQSVHEINIGDMPSFFYIGLALVALQYWVIAGLHIPYVKPRWHEFHGVTENEG